MRTKRKRRVKSILSTEKMMSMDFFLFRINSAVCYIKFVSLNNLKTKKYENSTC